MMGNNGKAGKGFIAAFILKNMQIKKGVGQKMKMTKEDHEKNLKLKRQMRKDLKRVKKKYPVDNPKLKEFLK